MSKSSPGTPEKTVSGGRLHNTVVYVKQHWQLYLLFLISIHFFILSNL